MPSPPPLWWPLQTKVPEHSLSPQHSRNLLKGKIRALKKPFFLTPCFCVPELHSGRAEKHPCPPKLGELKVVTYHHRGDTTTEVTHHHSATATGCSSARLLLALCTVCSAAAFFCGWPAKSYSSSKARSQARTCLWQGHPILFQLWSHQGFSFSVLRTACIH